MSSKIDKLNEFLFEYEFENITSKNILKCFKDLVQKFSCCDEELAKFWSLNHIDWEENVFICKNNYDFYLLDYLGNKLKVIVKGEVE